MLGTVKSMLMLMRKVKLISWIMLSVMPEKLYCNERHVSARDMTAVKHCPNQGTSVTMKPATLPNMNECGRCFSKHD